MIKFLNYFEHRLLLQLRLKYKVKTMGRGSIITEDMLGKTIDIYNGVKYFPLTLVYEMIGYKLGDFIFTKRRSKEIHLDNKIATKKHKKQFKVKGKKKIKVKKKKISKKK